MVGLIVILGHPPDLMGKDATVKQASTGLAKKSHTPKGAAGGVGLGECDVLL